LTYSPIDNYNLPIVSCLFGTGAFVDGLLYNAGELHAKKHF